MDKIMSQNIQLLDNSSKFNKDYYRARYVEAINKIAHMTGRIVDLQQQLIDFKLSSIDTMQELRTQILTLTEQMSQLDKTDNNNNDNKD